MIDIKEQVQTKGIRPGCSRINKEIYKKYRQFFSSPSEMVYYYKNPKKAESERYCKTCGKLNSYLNINLGYSKYCSSICANSNFEKKQKIKKNVFDKYGVYHVMHLQNTKDKIKNTCLQKYGVSHYAKTQECKEKTKQTCLQKYGVDSANKTKEHINKNKLTCLKKYNVDNISKTQYFKDFLKGHQQDIQGKRYITMKKHNSFNKSSSEELIYQKLLQKFNKDNIIRQYKSNLYPYRCDFYIKSLELYLEYNGSWVHGIDNNKMLGAFNSSNQEHVEVLNKWKAKKTKYYNHAIKVWTILDPLKLQTFRDNKLNYKIFYSIEEFDKWYQQIS